MNFLLFLSGKNSLPMNECLNANIFYTLDDAKKIIEAWREVIRGMTDLQMEVGGHFFILSGLQKATLLGQILTSVATSS